MAKQIEIWQDNALTVARYEMTEAEKNIMYMVIASIRKDDPPTKMYQVSLKEIAALTGSTELMYDAYKQATRRLLTRVIETELSSGDLLQASFIASAEYKKGKGIIEVELSQKVRPLLIELNARFTKFQLRAAMSLKSAYAKRIYELLCMYKNMKDKTFKKSIVDLKAMLGVTTVIGNQIKDHYPDWTKFKHNVLNIAYKEINGSTDITFDFKPVVGKKQGRGRKPVDYVEFTVVYQQHVPNEVPVLNRLTKDFRLRKDQAYQIIDQYDIDEINRILYDIQLKRLNKEIRNIGSYTARVFNLNIKGNR